MQLRLICREQDCNAAAHVSGASAEVFHRTFDIEAPAALRDWLLAVSGNALCTRTIIGVEFTAERGEVDGPGAMRF